MFVHATADAPAGRALLRDLHPGDVNAADDFWYSSGDDFLDFLGIDRPLPGAVDDTRQRFLRAVPGGDPNQPNIALAIVGNDEFAGYTLRCVALWRRVKDALPPRWGRRFELQQNQLNSRTCDSVAGCGVDFRKISQAANGASATSQQTGVKPKWSTIHPISGEMAVCIKP